MWVAAQGRLGGLGGDFPEARAVSDLVQTEITCKSSEATAEKTEWRGAADGELHLQRAEVQRRESPSSTRWEVHALPCGRVTNYTTSAPTVVWVTWHHRKGQYQSGMNFSFLLYRFLSLLLWLLWPWNISKRISGMREEMLR